MKKLFVLSLFLVFIGVVGELFDEHYLVLQWPQSFCKTAGQPQPPLRYPCRSADHPYFTIHGLCPQKNKKEVVCSRHPKFNYGLIDRNSKLLEDLKHFWPNLTSTEIEEGNKEFWAKEWEKHGTCTTGKFGNEANAQTDYFERAVDLAKTIPLTKPELINDLEPGNEYTTEEIKNAIVMATNYTPRLRCKTKGKKKKGQKKDKNEQQYLFEVILCVDEHAKGLKDCVYDAGNCPKDKIAFPTGLIHDEL